MKKYIKAETTDLYNEDIDTRIALAINPNTNPRILARLVNDPSVKVQLMIASNRAVTDNLLNQLLDKVDPQHRAWYMSLGRIIAENPNVSTEILDRLADIFSEEGPYNSIDCTEIMRKITQHKNASPDCLANAVQTKDAVILMNVASNPNTPQDILEAFAYGDAGLSRGIIRELQCRVIKNPNTPMDVVEYLRKNPDIAEWAIYNINLPFEERKQMAADLGVESSLSFSMGETSAFEGLLYQSFECLIKQILSDHGYDLIDYRIRDLEGDDDDDGELWYDVTVRSSEIINNDWDQIEAEVRAGLDRMGLESYNFDWF